MATISFLWMNVIFYASFFVLSVFGEGRIWDGDCGAPSAPHESSSRHSRIHLYPWLISIRKPRDTHAKRYFNFRHYAGAALIRSRKYREESDIALTSGFYCKQIFSIGDEAVFGAERMLQDGLLSVQIASCEHHSDYDASNGGNDIGIIKLKWPVRFTDHIKPICLPHAGHFTVGVPGAVTGWDLEAQGTGLREVQMKTAPAAACHRPSHEDELCVAGRNKEKEGYSYVDVGVPFATTVNGRQVMTGVAVHFWDHNTRTHALEEVLRGVNLNHIDPTKNIQLYLLEYVFPLLPPAMSANSGTSHAETNSGVTVYAPLPALMTRVDVHVQSGWIENRIKATSLLWAEKIDDTTVYMRKGSCGVAEFEATESIDSSVAAALSQPWLLSIRRPYGFHYGTASLIRASEDHEMTDIAITTAVTCKEISQGDQAVFGSHDTNSGGASNVTIEYCIHHKRHGTSKGANFDIGIIKFSSFVPFTKHIKPLCLPQANEDLAYGAEGMMMAWNRPVGKLPSGLRQIPVQIVEAKKCDIYYPGKSDDAVACVDRIGKSVGVDTFRANGGPLVIKQADQWILAGMTVWHGASGHHAFPLTVQRMARFIRNGWILNMVQEYSQFWNGPV